MRPCDAMGSDGLEPSHGTPVLPNKLSAPKPCHSASDSVACMWWVLGLEVFSWKGSDQQLPADATNIPMWSSCGR